MGIPAGAKIDRATGRYIMPEGFVKKAAAAKKALASPSAQAEKAEQRYDRERRAARNISYRLFAIHPSGKYWLQDVVEVNLAMIANNYGGGRYEAWKFDSSTGEYSGDPVPYNVDPTVHPVRGGDPATASRQALQGAPAYGGQGFFGGQGPQAPGMGLMPYGAPPAPAAPGQLTELKEEIEDLEEENADLLSKLANMTAQRDEAKTALERERAEWLRKESENKMMAMFAELKGAAKDPTEQMLSMIRLQAEMSGGIVGKGQASDPIATAVGLMTVIMNAAKAVPVNEGPGGALAGMLQVAKDYLPLISNIVKGKADAAQVVDEKPQGAPAAAPPPTPAPQPAASPAPPAWVPALKSCFDFIPSFISGTPESYADWVGVQTGPGWPELHDLLRIEKPEAFLSAVEENVKGLADTEEKKKWILEAATAAQAKLLNKKAQEQPKSP